MLFGKNPKLQLSLIIIEILSAIILIYISTIFHWPKQEYIRFLIFVPLYHGGTTFGAAGGITTGVVVSLLYLPLIPISVQGKGNSSSVLDTIALITFLNIFTVYISVAIGGRRRTGSQVKRQTEANRQISEQTDIESVMRLLAAESLRMVDALYAVVLFRGENPTSELSMAVLSADSDAFLFVDAPEDDHPLAVSMNNGRRFMTNSVGSDQRFVAFPESMKHASVLTLPVGQEPNTVGSMMLIGKPDKGVFTGNLVSRVSRLGETAAANISGINQEIKRQQEMDSENRMYSLFSRFVPVAVADMVLDNPQLLESRWHDVTILVSDIRDFTTISESMSPERLVAQLNEYFDNMVEVIFQFNGTVDKFIGDCIIAYWGAPVKDPDHAANASRAALAMQSAVDELNRQWTDTKKPPFRTGIALHTGRVILGNVGDRRKQMFTIMGEEVETAIALESLTKKLGARTIVSSPTASAITTQFSLSMLEGKLRDMELFELKGIIE